jgi:hypothetical protein
MNKFTTEWERKAEARLAAASCYAPSFVYSPQDSLWGEPEIIGFGTDAFAVKVMDRNKANAIIRANHYSRVTYSGSYIHLGVYAPELLGVLQFGAAMNPASQASVVAETEQDEYLELNRMWLDDKMPRNSESRAVSLAMTYIKRRYPKIAWVQSFADERCGRHGVVYQACNFIYCGEHTSIFWELDGDMYHNSLMTRNPELTPKAKIIQDGKDRAIPHKLRQFRYLYFLKRAFRKRLLLKVCPYPKHASEVSMETRPITNGERQGQFLHDAPISPSAQAHNDESSDSPTKA